MANNAGEVPAARLLFLPGLMCDARIFAEQLRRFPGSVAVNGYGLSRTITDMARRALDTVSGPLSLVGHSMGARVAAEAFRLAPERVERIAFFSTGIHPVRPGEADARHHLCELGRTQGVDALVDQWLPPMVAPDRVDDAALITPLRTMCREVGVEVFAAQVDALLSRPLVEPVLPQIRCPALVAVGSEDRWSPPAQHEAIAAALPDARLHVIDHAGHMLPAEAPELLNATIADWLTWPTHAQGVS
ncbi:alpha/beta fold hydrolase [Sphingomonas glaciei]|uniref:Alpha/beta hydrolase n=1 Tax=Sphingomonas glaciei TaxID=2938948 RepID=A0ABY5MWW7_9SPHN|nr:alpha/beta hydrolase [Sphingomonas glaciei]UUR08306.1 alpha/beta hydrolase [Sphingomonas glaciei]